MIKANAQEFLEPENGLISTNKGFDTYYLAVKKYLLHNLTNYPTARVIVIPSFSTEYTVSVETDSLGYFIFFRTYSKSILQEYRNEKIIENALEVEYKNRIDSTLADQLHEIFYISASTAKFPPFEYFTMPFGKNAGKKMRKYSSHTDGESYFFSAFENGIRSGKTWSPQQGTRMDELVQITNLMKAFSYDKKYGNQLKVATEKYLLKIEKINQP